MAYRARAKSRTALRDAMQANHVSVRKLADLAGCGKSIVGLLRSGARTSCSPEVAANIAAALDIPTDHVFRIEERG